jgi:SAM-dependent methyltransferase
MAMVEHESQRPPKFTIETRVGEIPFTLRGIDAYERLFGMQESEMETYMCGNVCDIGSGCDGLAVSVQRSALNCRVYSVNPRRSEGDYLKKRKEAYERAIGDSTSEFFTEDPTRIEQILSTTDTRATADYSHSLSFPDNYFQTAFDSFATMHYSDAQFPEIYQMSLREMTRVVAPQGHLLIIDWHTANPNTFWYRDYLVKLGWNMVDSSKRNAVRFQKR